VASSATAPAAPGIATKVSGLRANCLAAVVMLLIEFVLGIWVNLYAQLPSSDSGHGPLSAFGRAVADGPVMLGIHALLGTLLLITAIAAVVRAALARRAAWIAVAAVALLAIAVAWFSGTRFVGHPASGASFSMAVATAVALLGYVVILFMTASAGTADTPRPDSEVASAGSRPGTARR
jgi:hypothetical protein